MTNMQVFCVGLFLGCSFTAAVMAFIGLVREVRLERRWKAERQKYKAALSVAQGRRGR